MKALRCVIFLSLLSGYTLAQENILQKYSAGKMHTGHTLQQSFFLVKLFPGVKNVDLKRNHIEIVRTLPDNYYIVKANESQVVTTKHLLAQVHYANNRWKLSENVSELANGAERIFTVKVFDIKKLEHFLLSEKIEFVRSNNVVRIKASSEFILKKVIDREEVLYVGYESYTPREESRVLDLNLNPNNINQVHHSYPDVAGEGMMLSIKELRFNTEDIDLKGRSVLSSISASEISNHATDMATIAAGAGNSFITGKGAAPETTITSSDFTNLSPDPNESFTSLNISTQNHSYGTMIENMYGVLAEQYDQNANDLTQLLHVFSSGNEGTATSTQGPYNGVAGFANLTGNFKMSKNTLSIGSVDTTGNTLQFSSRGPAYDGRIKPELVAYSVQGSSNSAALVSGAVILLQHAYKDINTTIPPSALVKSVLINSADDAGPAGVDFITGYGNVNAFRAIENLKQGNYFSGTINHGEIKTFNLNIPSQAANLKVTLVWNDPAAPANSATALVNDVDIKLTTSTAAVLLPWVLNSSPSVSQLSQPATRGKDALNNVEQITLQNPEPGTYTISVEGFDVPEGPQEFYISYQWDVANSFEWEYPTGSDNFPYNGETGTYFYWHSTFPDANGILEYTTDDGANWVEITSNAQLQEGYYRWSNPPSVFTVAKARMRIGASAFLTENFTISYQILPSVGFNCSDSVMIKWDPVEGVTSYDVFALGEKVMEPLTTTQDNSFVLYKDQIQSVDYAVQPHLPGGKSGIRSPSVNYETFGVGCYLLSFYDEVVPEEGIYLNIILGTTHGVESIVFERQSNNIFQGIGTLEPGESELIRLLDDEPNQGFNRYRAQIHLDNGEVVFTEVIEDFFLTKVPFAVFPNPVSSAAELMIFSKIFTDQSYTFTLFKTDGSVVSTLELNSDREFLPLEGIPAGMYIYHIVSEENRVIGKLIVK